MTADRKDLWLELGCEELPPAFLQGVGGELEQNAKTAFAIARCSPRTINAYATPRRLVVVVQGVPTKQEGEVKKVVGPGRDRALDAEGKWTAAALGFLKKWNVPATEARFERTEKGEYLVAEVTAPRRATGEVLGEAVTAVFGRLGFPRVMRWPQSPIPFARPARWLVCVYGGQVAAASYAGLVAGYLSYGHRTLAPGPADVRAVFDGEGALDLDRVKAFYRDRLGVLVDVEDRRRAIVEGLHSIPGVPGNYFNTVGHHIRRGLEEVLCTVEKPTVIGGTFEPKYLWLPEEIIESALLNYVHCFPTWDEAGVMRPWFFAVHNAKPEASNQILKGIKNVINARLADALFFYKNDIRTPLDEMYQRLGEVLYVAGAGTLKDKTDRLIRLVGQLKPKLRLSRNPAENAQYFVWLKRAAKLCKADLVSQTVREKEFTHLQGIMGYLIAKNQGEPAAVYAAIANHYQTIIPLTDNYPDEPNANQREHCSPAGSTGKVLAVIDKLDSIVVLFKAGYKPTSTKDPYGLRRYALSLCRILINDETGIFKGLGLKELITDAAEIAEAGNIIKEIYDFVLSRLAYYFLDQKYRDDMVEAIVYLARESPLPLSNPRDMRARLDALQAFHGDRAAYGKLALAFKRPINILRQARDKKLTWGELDESRVLEPEERKLLAAYRDLAPKVRDALSRADYRTALSYLAALRPTVDVFFDTVMVMTDDAGLRANRLALMQLLADLFLSFADFTRLRGEEEYA